MISLLFNAIKHASNYFRTDASHTHEINDINEALNILEDAKESHTLSIEDPAVPLDQSCCYRTGVVTAINSHYIFVDNRYTYETVNTNNFAIGDKIYYLAYQKDKNQEEKICKIINVINDSWDTESIKSEEIVRAKVFKRNIVGKVQKRQGRMVVIEPNDICFNLDEITSNFVPLIGDWLKVECTVEVNEDFSDFSGEVLEVEKIQPLRSKLTIGVVSSYNPQKEMGVIDGGIVFHKRICESGYIPQVGDKVVSESIESDQHIYMWRSLTIVPLEQMSSKQTLSVAPSNAAKNSLIDKDNLLFKDKCDISITNDLRINLNMNEQQEICVTVRNDCNTSHQLCKTFFASKKTQSQLTLLHPSIDTTTLLMPNDEICYKFNCQARFVGRSEETFIFRFDGFEIGRVFCLDVNPKNSITRTDRGVDSYKKNVKYEMKHFEDGMYIPGIRPCKPPNFIKVRTGVFRIPQHYWNAVLNPLETNKSKVQYEMSVGESIPCLLTELRFETYKDRFHALLYLEEIAAAMELQRYDMDCATLKRCGEYLVLQVLGLAEKRPSLLPGDRVIISHKWDSSEGQQKYEGYIHKTTSTEVFLKFNQNFHEQYNGEDCQVSFKSSNSSFNRCHNAVNQAIIRLGSDFLFPKRVVQKKPQLYLEEAVNGTDSVIKQREHKRSESNASTTSNNTTSTSNSDNSETPRSVAKVSIAERLFNTIPIQHSPDTANNAVHTSPKDENSRVKASEPDLYASRIKKRKLTWYNKKLNDYQKTAVRNVLLGLARPLPYVIFGPPGTGKTITLCETVLQILTTISESRLLIATPSNSSANLIAERLLDSGILKPGDLVRLIAHHCLNDDSIPTKLLAYCATAELAAEGSRASNESFANGVRKNCTMTMLGRHRITVGTCGALGILHNMGFPRGHFTHVLVDEAGQATEPEIMIPLNFIHSECGQVILAGDPMQLGPVVQSQLAQHFGYGESFLCRLLHSFPYQKDPEGFETGYDHRLVTKLVINYRSLPEILQISNQLFYESELIPKVCPVKSSEAKLLQSLSSELPAREGSPPAIIFHGINGENYRESDSPSWYNPAEATQVYFYILKLYAYGLSVDDIGIITPYQKQVHQIRDLLLELDVQAPKVSSVEGFQGQERKVIILSTVRSSKNLIDEDVKHSLGFIASPRRLNVAITRARALLIILGNPWLLSEDVHWRNILKYCIDQGGYTGCNFAPLDNR